MASLSGQVGIVTGAGRGIGRAVAQALAAEGMSVGLIARSADQLDGTKDACEAAGGRAATVAADVSDHAAIGRAFDEIQSALGAADLLVANAGVQGPATPLWSAGYEDWWHAIQVNLGGVLASAAAALPGMVDRGRGRLVHMNSLVGTRDAAQYGAYSVSKAALLRLGGVLASSLAGTGVVVLDISPGLVQTDMTRDMKIPGDPDGRPLLGNIPDEAWTPIERVGEMSVAVAQGRLDALAGRLVHAKDDWDGLAARAVEIAANDGRTLRLTPAGPDDPLLSQG